MGRETWGGRLGKEIQSLRDLEKNTSKGSNQEVS